VKCPFVCTFRMRKCKKLKDKSQNLRIGARISELTISVHAISNIEKNRNEHERLVNESKLTQFCLEKPKLAFELMFRTILLISSRIKGSPSKRTETLEES